VLATAVAVALSVALPAQGTAFAASDDTSTATPTPTPTAGTDGSVTSPAPAPSETNSSSDGADAEGTDLGGADPSLAVMNEAHNHSMGSTIPQAATSGPKTRMLAAPLATRQSGVQGLDVSAWQTLSRASWTTIYNNGARFAYVKATESTDYVSSQFAEQYGDSAAAGLLHGAYHFATPNTSSGATQARYFVAHGGGWSSDGRTLPPLLDIEYNPYGATCYGLSQASMVSWIRDFSNTVNSLTGRFPAIYSTTDWWTQCTGNNASFTDNLLFIAHYTTASTPGTLPASWSTYTFWQWADSGTFPGDQDVFNGSLDELRLMAGGTSLITASGDPGIYLVAAGERHHVLGWTDYLAYASRLGSVTTVSASYLKSIPLGGDTNRLIRDPRDQRMYLLQVDGTKHYFPTQALVLSYGFTLNSFTNLDGSQMDSFTTGATVGKVFNIETAPAAYVIDGSTKRYLPTWHAAQHAAGSTSPFIAQMPAAGAAALKTGPVYVVPNYPVTERDISKVYIAVDDHTLIYLPSFGLASDVAGTTSYDVVPNGSLKGLTTLSGSLSPIVTCGSTTYIASNGTMVPVSGTNYGGLKPLTLPTDACSSYRKSSSPLTGSLLVQPRGQGAVYQIDRGHLRHILSYSTLVSLAGSKSPRILSWSAETARQVPTGAPTLGNGDFVRFSGNDAIYLYRSGALHHVTTWNEFVKLGGRASAVSDLPSSYRSWYSFGANL